MGVYVPDSGLKNPSVDQACPRPFRQERSLAPPKEGPGHISKPLVLCRDSGVWGRDWIRLEPKARCPIWELTGPNNLLSATWDPLGVQLYMGVYPAAVKAKIQIQNI